MKSHFPLYLYPIFILILILSTSTYSHAQFFQSSDISLSINPASPGPNTDTVATITSFSTDINRATISWFLNGKFVSGGLGKNTYSFKTGAVGASTKVSASIITAEANTADKSITITPGELDVLWQATDAHTPPFYRGKALPLNESSIRFVAVPNLRSTNGSIIKGSDLVYSWQKNLKPDASASGFGKNYFDVYASYLDEEERVDVSASSVSNHTGGSGNTSIHLSTPKIIFYKKIPLLGADYNNAIGGDGLLVDTKEVTVVAEPYFINPKNIDSTRLSYNWYSGREQVSTPAKKNELLMSFPNSKSGQVATISLSITNLSKLFGATTGALKVILK